MTFIAKKTLHVLTLFTFLFAHLSNFAQTVTYQESSAIISNPERGLQKYSITSDAYSTTAGTNNLSTNTLEGWKNSDDKVTVVYRYFLLDAFFDTNINETYLDNIQNDFDNVRAAGLKIIVRFSYSNAQGSGLQQPVKSQILEHINQLTAVFNENEDIILSHQAGFLGTWGEWYYTNSDEFGTDGSITAAQWVNRKEIIEAMLAATPAETPLQVRYAVIKTTMYGNTQLTSETAYQNTPNARIGFYNDAFLNNFGDQGTYSVSSECTNPVGTADYDYIANETKYLPMTGETNGLNPCDNGNRTSGENAINELDLTNWTTINRDYYTPFWDNLISSNHYDEIIKNLGYRFVLTASTVTANDADFDISISLSNVGYATPINNKPVYLILENTDSSEITSSLLETDIRTWESEVTITQNISPTTTGTFNLYLWIPDSSSAIASNPDYSIQFANENTWVPESGYNNLSQTVTLNTLGVDSIIANTTITLYPNPASDVISIELPNTQSERIRIYDIHGKLIRQQTVFTNDQIEISRLSNGLYFMHFDNPAIAPVKFLKL